MKILILVLEDAADITPLIAAIPSGSVLCGIEDTDPVRAAESLKAFADDRHCQRCGCEYEDGIEPHECPPGFTCSTARPLSAADQVRVLFQRLVERPI